MDDLEEVEVRSDFADVAIALCFVDPDKEEMRKEAVAALNRLRERMLDDTKDVR